MKEISPDIIIKCLGWQQKEATLTNNMAFLLLFPNSIKRANIVLLILGRIKIMLLPFLKEEFSLYYYIFKYFFDYTIININFMQLALKIRDALITCFLNNRLFLKYNIMGFIVYNW